MKQPSLATSTKSDGAAWMSKLRWAKTVGERGGKTKLHWAAIQGDVSGVLPKLPPVKSCTSILTTSRGERALDVNA